MPEVYLFTWNLQGKRNAHDLALQHLAMQGVHKPFVACFQEVPAESKLALARGGSLALKGIAVVSKADLASSGVTTHPRAMALAFHPDLKLLSAQADPDGEFIAAIFQPPSSKKTLGVIGLHAASKVNMQHKEDQAGSRALLRHAINELKWTTDHTVILGDWNSHIEAREITSWHCFYALSPKQRALLQPGLAQRRGVDHKPYYLVVPQNHAVQGTYDFTDTGGAGPVTLDFIAVDEATRGMATSSILTALAATPVASNTGAPSLSDHLPVEGTIQL